MEYFSLLSLDNQLYYYPVSLVGNLCSAVAELKNGGKQTSGYNLCLRERVREASLGSVCHLSNKKKRRKNQLLHSLK